MNISELNKELKRRRIPQMLYSLNQSERTVNRMSLRPLDCGKYIIFFETSSGNRLDEMIFDSEQAACDYMFSAFNKYFLK
jgi:hypothetical protein